jgi:FkbM family methyltransferase
MRVEPGEGIGRSIWQLGIYDLAVSEALWRLVSPGDLAIDVGANIGFMTGLMALRAGRVGAVRAFEPHPRVFAALQENLALFRRHPGVAAMEAFPQAVSDRAGTAVLYDGEHFTANHGLASLVATSGPSLTVATTTLDAVLGASTAAVVKIDVEGSEQRVLSGAATALREGRIRHILYEAYSPERGALEETMRGHGYTVFGLGRRFLGPLLSPAGEEPRLPGYEAPSFLATREPDDAALRLRPSGWQVFSART